jgi:copper transport protein
MRRGYDEIKLEKNTFINSLCGVITCLYVWHSWRKLFIKTASPIIVIVFLYCFITPTQASAHAILTHASPDYNSELEQSPQEISLSFNERLQKDLYRIEVINTKGEAICCEKATLNKDQNQIQLKLPELIQGYYTVTYVVISNDGHPIQASYVFSIGQPQAPPPDAALPGTSLHSGHSASGPEGFWAYRIFYYFALLLMSGWILWRPWIPMESTGVLSYKRIGHYLQLFHLITLVGLIIYQFSSFLLGWSLIELINLIPHTLTGISWICSISLSLLGLLLLQRWRSLDMLWICLLLFSKSINGHAAASSIPWSTIMLDFIHLIAASLWVSGLAFLIIFKKSHATRFYPLFSKAALCCIVLLILSGSLYTLLILPSLFFLFYTAWGILLLCKIGVVCFVLVTGAMLRKNMYKGSQADFHRWLRFDVIWMMSIVVIAAIFSYLNPLPANEPLIWKETKAGIQMTCEISPMLPGTNQFTIQLEAPLQDSVPKQAELWLTSNKTELAPIQVPLKLAKSEILNEKNLFTYSAKGPYLAYPSLWKAEIKLIDTQFNEITFTKKFRLFP